MAKHIHACPQCQDAALCIEPECVTQPAPGKSGHPVGCDLLCESCARKRVAASVRKGPGS